MVRIRRAVVNDALTIAQHRVAMFREMGQVTTDALAAELREASFAAIRDALADGSYCGWLAVTDDDEIVAGAGAHLKPQLPRVAPDGQRIRSDIIPLVVNVYTEVAWRKQGIARRLMQVVMQWASEQGFDRVLLHASDAGRPLYQSLGFAATNEMRWVPPHDTRDVDR